MIIAPPPATRSRVKPLTNILPDRATTELEPVLQTFMQPLPNLQTRLIS
ncbi:hypothetical protein [Spirulina sp. 06S082]|nr:hypothetical protein [Spirulina sp. 06S082]MEA5472231.1 hypothetical protein [Spirulina sp. 06S082]